MRKTKPVIALMEDNPADAELFRFALEQTGREFEFLVFKNGSDALHYVDNFERAGESPRCDLMILDLNVPVVSGFEVLEHMRSTDELRKVPVVVISGSSNHEDVNRCYAAGANSYISKATNVDEILAITAGIVHYWFECVQLPVAAGASLER
ncbi:MAG: response regulator [Candidatus Solibacter sp.]